MITATNDLYYSLIASDEADEAAEVRTDKAMTTRPTMTSMQVAHLVHAGRINQGNYKAWRARRYWLLLASNHMNFASFHTGPDLSLF